MSTFEKIEATTKRLEILQILTQFLLVVAKRDPAKDAKTSNLLKVVYLCINRLCPDYEGTELGIGESLLVKAIAESTGRNANKIKEDLRKEGDLGKVAMVSGSSRPQLTSEFPKRSADDVQAQASDCSVRLPEPYGYCQGVGQLGTSIFRRALTS